MNKLVFVSLAIIFCAFSLPTSYDIRYQPQNAIYANF